MLAVVVGSLLSQHPSPSCMLNNESCPIPRGWEADWSVLNSSAMMAAAESDGGFKPVHKWGYVTLDWQAGMLNWLQRPPGSTARRPHCWRNCCGRRRATRSWAVCSPRPSTDEPTRTTAVTALLLRARGGSALLRAISYTRKSTIVSDNG